MPLLEWLFVSCVSLCPGYGTGESYVKEVLGKGISHFQEHCYLQDKKKSKKIMEPNHEESCLSQDLLQGIFFHFWLDIDNHFGFPVFCFLF